MSNAADCTPEDASPAVLDDIAFNKAVEIWGKTDKVGFARTINKLRSEERYLREQEAQSTRARAERAASIYEQEVRRNHSQDASFLVWDPNRALDRQDFDYLLFHRERFVPKIRAWLEIIASKISHINRDGQDGYFNKLERNVGWTRYITPILFSGNTIGQSSMKTLTDKLVRCGLWANSKNSRRCHKSDYCPLCLWNDILKVLYSAFGRHSAAFSKARAWWLITIGWTTNLNNAKRVFGEFSLEDLRPSTCDRGYDPYPVRLGLAEDESDLPDYGYEDARTLGLVMQAGIDALYQRDLIDGYHYRLEGTYRLNPGGANRVNLHCHTVANGGDEDAEFIAHELSDAVLEEYFKYKPWLTRYYFPDIQVKRIASPEHLERSIVYSEKVVPIHHMFADAFSRSEAKLAGGGWNSRFIDGLHTSLTHLMAEQEAMNAAERALEARILFWDGVEAAMKNPDVID